MKTPIPSGGEAMPEITEDGPTRVCRLAKELSHALDDCEGFEMVIVHPKTSRELPVSICLMKDYARMTNAMFAYRDAYEAMMARFELFKASPAGQEKMLAVAIKGDAVGYFDAKHECDLAWHRLIASFETLVIEGEVA